MDESALLESVGRARRAGERIANETIPEYCTYSSWYWWNGTVATCGMPLNYDEPSRKRKDYPEVWQNTWGFMSRHPGGGNFAMADGSVHFIADTIESHYGYTQSCAGVVNTADFLYQNLYRRDDGRTTKVP